MGQGRGRPRVRRAGRAGARGRRLRDLTRWPTFRTDGSTRAPCSSTSSVCGARWTSSSATRSPRRRRAPCARRAASRPGSTSTCAAVPAIEGSGEMTVPRIVVKVDLAGVEIDKVALEVSGRELVITGERPVAETEGRVYQQVEIEAGPVPPRDRARRRGRLRPGAGELRRRRPPGRAAARRPGDPPRTDRVSEPRPPGRRARRGGSRGRSPTCRCRRRCRSCRSRTWSPIRTR